MSKELEILNTGNRSYLSLKEKGASLVLHAGSGTVVETTSIFIRTSEYRGRKEYLIPNAIEYNDGWTGDHLVLKDCNSRPYEVFIDHEFSEGICLRCTGPEDIEWIGIECPVTEDDNFIGFGERFDFPNQRGETLDLWVENAACEKRTYKPVPFFMIPGKYGLHICTQRRCFVHMATPEEPDLYSIGIKDNTMELRWFFHQAPADILEAYTGQMGRSDSPALWAFGPWKSRDWMIENQNTVYLDMTKQKELDIPCTVKLIDASWQSEYNSFSFNLNKFPEPQKMIDDLKDEGYRLILWISPWMHQGTGAFIEAEKKGYLATDGRGNTKLTRLGNDPDFRGAVFDFTIPEAVTWWKSRLENLMDMGVSGFKSDFGEQVDEDAVFSDGRTGKEMHNLFPYLYNKAAWEVVGPRGGVLLGRSAWHGSQKFHGIWAGDQSADLARRSGLPSVVAAGISSGYSGFLFWGSDIGGYFSTPEKETFIRWTEFGVFSPIMQIHGMGNHDPWEFDQETLAIYRNYAKLRMKLLIYISAALKEYTDKGLPLMRGLAFDYHTDPEVFSNISAQYEYLFGPSILAAPVCFGGMGRVVYLPEGRWMNWWSGEILTGGRSLRVEAEIDQIPLFIPEGAIIPLGQEGESETLEEIEIFPPVNSRSQMEIPGCCECRMVCEGDGILSVSLTNLKLKTDELVLKILGWECFDIISLENCSAEPCSLLLSAVSRMSEREGKGLCRGAGLKIKTFNSNVVLKLKLKGELN